MIIPTHRLLGRFLYKYVNTQTSYGYLLNSSQFVYGNMKPDIVNKYRTISHYYCHNRDFVYTLIDDLCQTPYPRAILSDRLGILMHFLADYTCVFHSITTLNSNEIQIHMKYETMLHLKTAQRLKQSETLKPYVFASRIAIKEYVAKMISDIEESQQHLNIERDIYNMTKLTLSVCLYILRRQHLLRQSHPVMKRFVPLKTDEVPKKRPRSSSWRQQNDKYSKKL